MAVAVVSSDEVEFSQGFGQTALVDGQKVDEHTLFAIASTTKAMVVSGLLMLVDEGKLSLDDPIIQHIPELHFAPSLDGETLRVRDLLAHRTGLPSTDFWSFFQDMPLEEQITRLKSVPLEAPVRSRLIYQNTMFDLAGLLIERLTGQRWDLFLQQRLWQPIGMNETFGTRGAIGADRAHVMPHYYAGDQLVLAEWDIPADKAQAAGSVWSSVHDMSLWAQFLLRDGITASGQRLISEASFADMFEPQQLASVADFYPTVELTGPHWRTYALGWFQQDFQGRKIDFHTGSLGGLIAIIGLDQASDRAVIVLGNRDHAEMRHAILWEVMDDNPPAARRDWNQDIFELYAGRASESAVKWQETEKKRIKDTRPALPLAAYAGIYRSPLNGDLVVELSGDNLVFKTALISAHGTGNWTPSSSNTCPGICEFASFHIGNE
jgi:CubicO group peptidase (beta-lactamase class C family)